MYSSKSGADKWLSIKRQADAGVRSTAVDSPFISLTSQQVGVANAIFIEKWE